MSDIDRTKYLAGLTLVAELYAHDQRRWLPGMTLVDLPGSGYGPSGSTPQWPIRFVLTVHPQRQRMLRRVVEASLDLVQVEHWSAEHSDAEYTDVTVKLAEWWVTVVLFRDEVPAALAGGVS